MNRLTRTYTDEELKLFKEEMKEPIDDYVEKDNVGRSQIIHKLGQLEDIEDKIGIEIVDFFKLRDAKKLYLLRVKGYAEIIGIDLQTMEIHVHRKIGCPKNYNLKIRNFGKTWLFEKPKK